MVSSVLFLSFGVSCLLDWLGQPFFVCHQHLWFGLSFFATSICGLVFLSLPQAFVVCSFFLCHRHLCTVSFFHGLFCRRHSCYTFCLSFDSACFRVSVYLSIFGIMLCACCSSASSLEIRTGIFSESVTLWTILQIRLWSKPHLVFHHRRLRNRTQRSARYTYRRDWGAASKSARLNCTHLTHFRITAGRFRGNSCIVMLWVACELLQFAATQ